MRLHRIFQIFLLYVVRQSSGTQPAQYIRLTTAQALAAGILPAMGPQGEQSGTQQHFQLAGNKVVSMVSRKSL